jgi:type I restriction enzyme R subunit
LLSLPASQDIAKALKEAMKSIEDHKPELAGVLPKDGSFRLIREGLTEDELELFDLLKKDKMTKAEIQRVRLAAKALLHRLRDEAPVVLVQDWFKDSQSRQRVKAAVETVLHEELPDTYDRTLFAEKCNIVFDTILTYASQGTKWAA